MNTKHKIIALTGPKGSGKDTVADMIVDKYVNQYDVSTVAFADPIKKVVQHIFGLDDRTNDEYDQFKRTTLTFDMPRSRMAAAQGRHVVREIGMLMRGYDERQFNDYVSGCFERDPNRLWIVTDMRFDNEYTMLKQYGAKVIKIIRPQYQYDGHITERAFDDHLVDSILMNDGSLEFLKTRVDIVMSQLTKEWE